MLANGLFDLDCTVVSCWLSSTHHSITPQNQGLKHHSFIYSFYFCPIGCHPKCASNPCLNNGICVEYYSHYWCDCAYTPFRGWICGRGKHSFSFIHSFIASFIHICPPSSFRGHLWYSGSMLDCWPTWRGIDRVPGAWFITKFIIFAQIVPGPV